MKLSFIEGIKNNKKITGEKEIIDSIMSDDIKIKNNLPNGWYWKPFTDSIKPFRVDRSKQVQANKYQPEGIFPIVDQGQKLISGWTNDKLKVIKENLPLIVFGDHTRIFKYIDFPFAIGADGTKLIKSNNNYNPRYLYYQLMNLKIPSKGYSRHFKLLKEKKICFIPLPQQKKIAAILYKIQQAIELQDKIIEKTEDLKRSTMEFLFTHGLRDEKTKQTEIGKIPKNWEISIVNKNYNFTKKDKKLKYSDYKNITFVPMELIPNSNIYLQKYIQKPPNNLTSGTYFEDGDLLLSKITPCFENGKQCIVKDIPNGFGIATTEVIPIKEIPNKSDIYFLFYYLLKTDVRSYITGKMEGATGRQRVPVNILKELTIPFPEYLKQKKISQILITIDNKIEKCINKKNILSYLFKSMLNKLMQGKINTQVLNL